MRSKSLDFDTDEQYSKEIRRMSERTFLLWLVFRLIGGGYKPPVAWDRLNRILERDCKKNAKKGASK